jgi:hypothetical protein
VTTAKSLLAGDFNDYTVASAEMYEKKGALDTTPKKGAQVFFTKNGKPSGCHHTGIVYQVDDTKFYTIEGNTSGASGVVSNGGGVAKKSYSITAYKGKVIFGHPKYDTTSTASSSTSTAKKTSAPKLASSTPNLKKGSTGTQVGYLQEDLKYLGFKGKDGKALTVDKDFGANTEYALKAFQKKHSLTVDGIYGSKSEAKMKSSLK